MRLTKLLNPLQWNFQPRTIATLVAWAVLPLGVVGFVAVRSLRLEGTGAGLTSDQVDLLIRQMLNAALWPAVVLLAVAIVAAILFSYLVVQPLMQLRQGMERIARGDLAQPPLRISSEDEVGKITGSFNEMTAQLRTMVQTMAVTATELDLTVGKLDQSARASAQASEASSHQVDQVRITAEQQAQQAAHGTRAIRELQDAAGQVAAGASAQAREVEGASETIRQMATAIEQVASAAGVVAEAASRTRQAADDGSEAVQMSAGGMDQVRNRVLDAAEKIRQLGISLTHVDEILQLITEIAGQTDLLALNAAIEAARVGEHGKGFAVVAGEVRRLAERSRSAAAEIAGRVETLRHSADAVVQTMEAGTQDVERGVHLSRQAGEALDRILHAVAETQRQVDSISAASEEIAAASNQVVNATVQLSAIAEENAATAEQMLSSAQTVTDLTTAVEQDARKNQAATTAMAASSTQVRSAVEEMAALTGQVAAMAAKLHEQASRFRI